MARDNDQKPRGEAFERSAGSEGKDREVSSGDGSGVPASAPAPGLRPPGVVGSQPQTEVARMEEPSVVERKVLEEQTRRGIGQGRGRPDTFNNDWAVMKLDEALHRADQVKAEGRVPVDVAKALREADQEMNTGGGSYVETLKQRGEQARSKDGGQGRGKEQERE